MLAPWEQVLEDVGQKILRLPGEEGPGAEAARQLSWRGPNPRADTPLAYTRAQVWPAGLNGWRDAWLRKGGVVLAAPPLYCKFLYLVEPYYLTDNLHATRKQTE